MLIDVDQATARHLRAAIRQHAHVLRMSGVPVPPALAELAAELAPERVAERNRCARRRELSRVRMARSRARRRAESAAAAPDDDCNLAAAG
jgi:hypothetical protein